MTIVETIMATGREISVSAAAFDVTHDDRKPIYEVSGRDGDPVEVAQLPTRRVGLDVAPAARTDRSPHAVARDVHQTEELVVLKGYSIPC